MAGDELKVKDDDIKSIRDNLMILTKNMESNAENINELKKAFKEVQAKQSANEKNTKEDPLQWTYWSLIASGVAIIALIVALGK